MQQLLVFSENNKSPKMATNQAPPAVYNLAAPTTAPSMDWGSPDLPNAFSQFKQYCELYFKGPLKMITKEEQATYLLLWVGQQGLQMYNTWTFADGGDKKDPDKLLKHFENHIKPKENFRISRYHLMKERQKPEKNVDEYITRCIEHANKCKFRSAEEQNDRLIDQLIYGTTSSEVQRQLISKDDKLTLDEAVSIAKTHEATKHHMEEMRAITGTAKLDAIRRQKKETPHSSKKPCKRCGGIHPNKREACPAFGEKCKKCGKKNHWAQVCLAASSEQKHEKEVPKSYGKPGNWQHKQTYRRPFRTKVHTVTQDEDEDCYQMDELTLDTVTISSVDPSTKEADEIFTTLRIPLTRKIINLRIKVDSGAGGNILPLRIYSQMFPENIDTSGKLIPGTLNKDATTLTSYGGTEITNLGKVTLPCERKDKLKTQAKVQFFVCDVPGPALLGLKTSKQLRYITLNCDSIKENKARSPKQETNAPTREDNLPKIRDKKHLIELYPDCFEGLGLFEGEYHITLDQSVPPVIHAPRRPPVEIRERIKHELDEMVAQGIITKVDKPTDWVNSLVYKEKPNG